MIGLDRDGVNLIKKWFVPEEIQSPVCSFSNGEMLDTSSGPEKRR